MVSNYISNQKKGEIEITSLSIVAKFRLSKALKSYWLPQEELGVTLKAWNLLVYSVFLMNFTIKKPLISFTAFIDWCL
jgi:hypothetical protein